MSFLEFGPLDWTVFLYVLVGLVILVVGVGAGGILADEKATTHSAGFMRGCHPLVSLAGASPAFPVC